MLTTLLFDPTNFTGTDIQIDNTVLGTHDSITIESLNLPGGVNINLTGVPLRSLAIDNVSVAGPGVDVTLDSVTGMRTFVVETTTINADSGAGLDINLTNMEGANAIGAFVVNESTIDGVKVQGLDVEFKHGAITGSRLVADLGVEGILLDLESSIASDFTISENTQIASSEDSIRLELDDSPSDGITISDNVFGRDVASSAEFVVDGDTFSEPFALTNTSPIPANVFDPSQKITKVTIDVGPAGLVFDTGNSGLPFTPFTPAGQGDIAVSTGLISPTNIDPNNPTILEINFSTSGGDLTGFEPGETFYWRIDLDRLGGGETTISGADLAGSIVTVNYTDGTTASVVTGLMAESGILPDASNFVPSATSGRHGINVKLDTSPLTDLVVDNNQIQGNNGHGIVFNTTASDVEGVVSNNSVTGIAQEAVRFNLEDSDFRGALTGNNISGNRKTGISFNPTLSLTGLISRITSGSSTRINSPNHKMFGGETVVVQGVQGVGDANGAFRVRFIDADNFELRRLSDGLAHTSTGFYFGGGEWFAVTRPAQPTGRAGNIIGASNTPGSDIQISTAEPHNLGSTGEIVTVTLAHIRGNVAANGTHRVEVLGNSLLRVIGVKPTGDFDPAVKGAVFYEAMEMDFASQSNRLINGNIVTANLGDGLEVIVTPGIVFNADVIRNRFAANAGLGMEIQALSGGVGVNLGSDLEDVFGNALDRNVFDRNTGAGLAIILNDSAVGSYDVRGNQFLGTLDDDNGDTPYQGDGMFVSLEGTNPGVAATSILANSIVVGNSFGVDNLGNEGRGLFLRMQEDTLVDVVQVSKNQFVGNGKDRGSIRARLGQNIDNLVTNFSLVSNFSLPSLTPFVITIGTEKMLVNSVDGNRVTVIRGFDNTTAVAHNLGDFIVADNDNRDGDGFHFFRRDDSELRQLTVEKNTFSNNSGDGFELYMQNTGFAGVVGTDRLDLATFNENVLTNNGQFGLRIQALTDVRMEFTEFANNVIDFNGSRGKDGSVLDGTHPASNNSAGGIGVFGLQQVEVHFPLHQNQITNNIGDGVFFGFFSGAPSGFDVLTTRGVWSANDFSNNTRFGVRRDIGGFDKFTWINNKFNDNGVSSTLLGTPAGSGGISAGDTQLVIANGRLFPGGGFDIRVDGEEMTVTNITVDPITSVATLTVTRGANATYAAPHDANSIIFPLTGGGARVIGAEDTDILAISNEFLRNAGDGLRLGQGTKAVIGDGTIDGRNFFDNNLRDGLKITDGTSATMADLNQSRTVSAVANTFVGNGDDGVDVEAADTHVSLHHSAFFRNRADGVEFRNIGSTLPASLDIRDSRFSFNGFEPDASKLADLWGGRGIDVVQAGSGLTRVTILNNEVESNNQEGIYIVNSAAPDQPQFLSSDTLSQTGTVAATPNIELRLRENVIKSNGNAAVIPVISSSTAQPDTQTRFSPGAVGTGQFDGNPVVAPDLTRPGTLGGLVIRVGTADSDGGIGTFPGGGVTPESLNLGNIPATQLTGSKVKAEILDNEFDGNFGAEVYFDAFTSTQRPQTTWTAFNVADSPSNYSIPGGTGLNRGGAGAGSIDRDPLSRFDLAFRGNTGTTLDVINGTAFYSNEEAKFKSRIPGPRWNAPPQNVAQVPNPGGPFAPSATSVLGGRRQRNAMRTLGFNQNGAPSPIYNVLSATHTFPAETVPGFYFAHDGMGYQSTWRVEDDFEYAGFAFTTNRFGFSDFFDSIEHGVAGTLTDGNDYAWDTGRQGGGPTVNSLTSGDVFGIDDEAGDTQILPDIYEDRNSFLNNDSFVAASDLNDSTINIGGVATRVLNTPTTYVDLTIDVAGDADYYTFNAPANGPLNLQIQTDDSGTLEVFVYEVFPDRLIEEVATRLIAGTDTPVPVVVNLSSLVTYTNLNGTLPALTAGKQYYIRVEGTGSFGTQRDYELAISLPLAPLTGSSSGSSAPSFAPDADTEAEITNFDTPDFTPGDGYIADEFGRQTLRAGVDEANANGDADTFTLVSGTYTLTRRGRNDDINDTGDLDVRQDLTITGAGVGSTIINADLIDRVFHVHPGVSLTLNDMTLIGGDADRGGAILNEGNLVLNNVQINGNIVTSEGGGIYNSGATELQLATALNEFRTSTSITLRDGLPLSYTTGEFTIRIDAEEMLVTAVSGNTLTVVREYNGTALAAHVSNATVEILSSGSIVATDVVVSGNQALRGGGIANHGDIRLVDSEIRGNQATTSGGGILTGGTHADVLAVDLPRITTAITSIDVENGRAFRGLALPFNILIGTEELIVTAISGNTLTVRRAANSTAAATHVIGARVFAPSVSSSVLENVVVANNVSLSGGGITNRGEMTLITSTIIDNEAHIRGGAIFNEQGVLSTLNQNVTAATTGLAVEDASQFNTPTPFVIQIESEQMIVNSVVGNTLTVQRGANGTTATKHSARAAVRQLESGVLQVIDSYIGKIGTKVTASFDNAVDRFLVDDVSLFTDPVQFLIQIGDEQMEVLQIVGNELTVLRNRNGTFATSHFAGEPVHLLVDHGNNAPEGGGITNRGGAVIRTSSLSYNDGFNQGGGLFNQGSAWIDSSTLALNTVGARGGAVFNEGFITVLNTTMSGNSAASRGAGVFSEGTVTLLNSTVFNNSASSASGLENASDQPFRIGNVIAAENDFIISPGVAPSDLDVSGAFQSLGGNLIGDVDSATGFIGTDQLGSTAAPLVANLEPLGGNGGILLSHEPTLTSRAIDNGVTGLDFVANGSIESATNASPIVITSSNHGLFDGEVLTITLRNAAAATSLSGSYIGRVIDRHTFSLQTPNGNPVSGVGLDFSGGGVWEETVGRDQRGSRRGVSAVSVIPTPDAGSIERFVTSPLPFFTVTPNPTAPSEVVRLDATGSRHSNEPIGQIVSYLWDLDADGLYDDETGPIVQLSFDAEGSYPVRLQVIDNFGVERETAVQTILVDAPDPPVILTPSAPAITDHTPRLTWTDVGEHFDLVINEIDATGATIRSQVVRRPTLETNSYSVPQKLSAGIYRAWVRSFSSRGIYSAFSQPFDFEIRDMVITGPGTSFDRTPEITWEAIPGATNYEVWVADITRRISPAHRFRTIDGSLTKFEVPIGNAFATGRYRLEMRATDLEGNVGDWSNVFYFDVTAPVITSPPSPTASTVSTDFNLDGAVEVLITSIPLGPQGSATTVLVTKEDLGLTAEPVVEVIANQITVSLNANAGNVSTAQDFVDALNNDDVAKKLVRAELVTGSATADVTATTNSAGDLLSLGGGRNNGIFDATPLITWDPLPNANHYVVNVETFINGFRGGNIVHTGNLVTTTNYEIPDRLAPGDYYVTVDAVDRTGETSNRSPGHVIRLDLNQKVDTGIRTTLPGGISNAATQIVLNDIVNFTQSTPFQIQVDVELMTVTNIDATTKTLTVLRGVNGTTAVSHRAGVGIRELDGKTSPVGAVFDRTPEFTYKPILGAESYHIWVTLFGTDIRRGVGWSGIIRELGNTSDRLAADANLPSGNYRWQVQAVTDDGTRGPWSDFVYFTIPVVQITNPAPLGTTFTTPRPTFEFNAIGLNDLDDYEIWVDKVLPNGAGVDIRRIFGAKGITALQHTVPFDLPNGEYTIEMRAFERDGVGGSGVYRSDWTPTHRFQINSQLPDSPVLIAPVGVQITRTPTFTWVGSPAAVAYQVFIKNLTNGQIPVLSAVVTTPTFTPAGQFTPGIYRWWVRAFDVGGSSSGWSSPREFTIVQALPETDGGTDPTESTDEVLVAALDQARAFDPNGTVVIDAAAAINTSDPFGDDPQNSTTVNRPIALAGEAAPYQVTSWVHAAIVDEPAIDYAGDTDANVIDSVLQDLSSLGWTDLESAELTEHQAEEEVVFETSEVNDSGKSAWALALVPLGLGRFWTGKRRNRRQDTDV